MIKRLPENLISNNKYIVRFAKTDDDLRSAQQLRFKVFNLELGEGLETSYDSRLDKDEYDEQFHHLLVIERNTGEVIGTYRMQTYQMASQKLGFYSENEFDLSEIPQEVLQNSLEVGRACIAKEHRNGRVLYLLWRGLAKYLVYTQCRYLFGCCSITSQSAEEGWVLIDYLNHKDLLHSSLRVSVKSGFRCEKMEIDPDDWKSVKLPQLFRLYMDLGAKVCSPPAIDRHFKTIDYLVILDIESLDERMKMLFFN